MTMTIRMALCAGTLLATAGCITPDGYYRPLDGGGSGGGTGAAAAAGTGAGGSAVTGHGRRPGTGSGGVTGTGGSPVTAPAA